MSLPCTRDRIWLGEYWQWWRQFGNIPVLASTYKSKSLRHLVPKPQLEHLFERTIKFSRHYCNISATLDQDAKILEIIRQVIFSDKNYSHSFSSEENNRVDMHWTPEPKKILSYSLFSTRLPWYQSTEAIPIIQNASWAKQIFDPYITNFSFCILPKRLLTVVYIRAALSRSTSEFNMAYLVYLFSLELSSKVISSTRVIITTGTYVYLYIHK